MTLVFGANAAAGLRRENETAAEEVLPAGPGTRARISLWVAYVMWAIFSTVGVIFANLVTHTKDADRLTDLFANMDELGSMAAILFALVFLIAPAVAFACTYAVKNALAGVMAAPAVLALGAGGSLALGMVGYLGAAIRGQEDEANLWLAPSIVMALFVTADSLCWRPWCGALGAAARSACITGSPVWELWPPCRFSRRGSPGSRSANMRAPSPIPSGVHGRWFYITGDEGGIPSALYWYPQREAWPR